MFYVDEICNNKDKILKKLRKIGYNQFFANNFQVSRIDENFKDLENQEKAKIIGNVIDLLNYDQNHLKKKSNSNSPSKSHKQLDKEETQRLKEKQDE